MKRFLAKGTSIVEVVMWAGGIALATGAGILTYANQGFTAVNDKISEQAVSLSATTQKTVDIDTRLTRIEDKLDSVASILRSQNKK